MRIGVPKEIKVHECRVGMIPAGVREAVVRGELVKSMKRGSVIVDISIDQGGVAETSRPTTHAKPSFVMYGVVHYCVTNMPGAVARTSTFALNNATLPFILALANKGPLAAMREDPHLLAGLNVHRGGITHRAVAQALGIKHAAALKSLKA